MANDFEVAAQQFMLHKGYEIDPVSASRADHEDGEVWYFLYSLPEGRLEVEVDLHQGEWRFLTNWVE